MIQNALRKIALPASIAIFCVLIGLNASRASKNLTVIQDNAAMRADASELQSAITALDLDLQHVETGQRGYLLTGDESYLVPFADAVQKLPRDFSALRSRLAARPAQERALETKLEAVAHSKIDDADQTIQLRQKGYRHRAFLIVDSNRGRDLMEQARSLLSSLSTMESRNAAQYQQQLTASTRAARAQVLLASAGLLALVVIALLALDYRGKRLDRAYSRQAQQLRAATNRLDRVTSTLATTVLSTVHDMQAQSENLLRVHGGFLPRQGQEGTEWLYNASCHVHQVIDELLQPQVATELPPYKRNPKAVDFPETPELPRSHTA
ncbi:MAG: CHASE3 domain-containing protein [Terriglobales bacterium]